MSDINSIGDTMNPPGFRFSPTEEELMGFYLKNKLEQMREEAIDLVIPVVNIYRFDPWQLPRESRNEEGAQWFFFCRRQEREVHGGRAARTTPSGYWKATGSPSWVYSSGDRGNCRVMGAKKTMVFYQGRAPSGSKTNWKMHEYRALAQDVAPSSGTPRLRNEFSLCRVYSGTLRSFDRRPSVVISAENIPPLSQQDTTSSSHGSSTLDNNAFLYAEVAGTEIDWNSVLLDWD